MTSDQTRNINIANLPTGNFRSLQGYAVESLLIGEALLCGYNLFFKAWRDSPYDAVLDSNGYLFRIEIKGTSTDSLSVTCGGRAGQQISRGAQSREHIVTKDDCDFLIGISTKTRYTYVIPTEVIGIINKKAPTLNALNLFKNKWKIFLGVSSLARFSIDEIKKGFSAYTIQELSDLCQRRSITITGSSAYPWEGVQRGELHLPRKEKLILDIWKQIYSHL